MHDIVVSITDLRKSYSGHPAVDGISFEVHRGEIFGLLGPNGAGKTTTLECLEGLRRPDGGRMEILGVDAGRDARKLRNLIGVQLQSSGLPANMRVDEAMRFFCAYHDVAPRNDLIERLGLADKSSSQFFQLSTGQQRRLALALAIAHEPAVILLDEPTAGLDVSTRTELHKLLLELRSEGASIILATHDMAEAEKLADRVSILLKGKIVATGTPRELTATGGGLTRVAVRTEHSVLSGDDAAFPAVQKRRQVEDYVILYSTDPGPTVLAVLEYLRQKDDTLVDLRVERPSLEERFLEITTDSPAGLGA